MQHYTSELFTAGLPAAETSAAGMHHNVAWLRYFDDHGGLTPTDLAAFAQDARTHATALAAHLPERQAAELLRVVAEALPEAEPAANLTRRTVGDDSWKEKAACEALRIINDDAGKDRYASQANIGDRVAEILRSKGIFGPAGKPLSGAYIKRHALVGISSATKRRQSIATKRGK